MTDYDSDGSYSDDFHQEEFIPGGGFRFIEPLILGSLVISTSHDYQLQRTAVQSLLIDSGVDQDDLDLIDEDLGPDGDEETAFDSIRFLKQHLAEVSIQDLDLGAAIPDASAEELINLSGNDGVKEAEIAAIAEQFSLDTLASQSLNDSLKVNEYKPTCPPHIRLSEGAGPPRPPKLQGDISNAAYLRVTATVSRTPFNLLRYGMWGEMYPELNIGDESHFAEVPRRQSFGTSDDNRSTSSLSQLADSLDSGSRALTRPKGGMVFIVMEDGHSVNIGSHSLKIEKDAFYPLNTGSASEALSELFSAIAGEGLGCATPSHDLHQMASAVLSHALFQADMAGNTDVEVGRYDIVHVASNPDMPQLDIDITSTSGVHKKPLREYRMLALSKYDIGAIFSRHDDLQVSSAFKLAIANCLAVEHPAYYGKSDTTAMPHDLVIHHQISDRLHRLSQSSVNRLAEMSFEALVAESVSEAVGMDPFASGRTYREKADILMSGIHNLKKPEKIAIPPYPYGNITPLVAENMTICLGDTDVFVPSVTLGSMSNLTSFKPDNPTQFLQDFPAVGLSSYNDAWEVMSILQGQILSSTGMTHRGPVQHLDPSDVAAGLWDLAGDIYCSSSVAQFAEIRSDLVKAIDTHSMPPAGQWRMQPLYMNKVLAWYSSRDAVSDARGYRIDWFALSSFPVLGAKEIVSDTGAIVYLWPRQRIRSQEMEIAAMLPRRLKLTLFSMLEKAKALGATTEEVMLAWQRLALTATSSTWASAANYITCRHLSSSLSSPSPPFDSMVSKLKPPKTFACIVYLNSLDRALSQWDVRDKYHTRAALLDLPRGYSQLEAYWQVWVPDELADANKHMMDCAFALFEEAMLLESTYQDRYADASYQFFLISRDRISLSDVRESIKDTCTLDTGGKLGWSVFGSLAAAHALGIKGKVAGFDKQFSRGGKAKRLVDHLTVRHSARIDEFGQLHTGTVAEMILDTGVDDYLSLLQPTYRFYYGSAPIYWNHPKNGEGKDREISIADPDTRIMLNNAEFINGSYGRHTSVDMLKRPDKDAHFYKLSAKALLEGGAIQASDASRFSAMMSNIATGITNLALACQGGSAHLASSAATYRRLASRRMALSTEILEEVTKRLSQDRDIKELRELSKFRDWIIGMPTIGVDGQYAIKGYTTTVHTGQGMSHHGTSLAHGGALLVSIYAAEQAMIQVSGKRVHVTGIPMVTSDDSTIVAGVDDDKTKVKLSRSERQRACKLFLAVQRRARTIALRSVSVMQNLPKEKISGICGEFNSQDNGIGVACPVLGFRELICQLVRPSSGSLMGDYLAAYAYGQSVCLSGQGMLVGVMGQKMAIDAVESRWRMRDIEKKILEDSPLLPIQLLKGADMSELLSDPAALLPFPVRQSMLQLSCNQNKITENLDPHSQDSVFGPLLHIKIGMKRQHVQAITKIKTRIHELERKGLAHQALMLDQSLMATLSSARNRGVGRIGQRIRSRLVEPRSFLSCAFQKAPLLESTLTWLSHLESMVETVVIEPNVKEMAITYGSTIKVMRQVAFKYPQPITKRRSRSPILKKPVFVLNPYGQTPFGRHAIIRSGALLVDAIGPEHREMIYMYMAGISHRRIPEHTQYGDKFTITWIFRGSGTLVSKPMGPVPEAVTGRGVLWGSMDYDSLEFLRESEMMHEGIPVLSLNYAYGNVAHFHCVYKGMPYSHSLAYDPVSFLRFTCQTVIGRGGNDLILANQGHTLEKEWFGTGPLPSEIRAFQTRPRGPCQNSMVELAMQQVEKEGSLDVPNAAAKVVEGGKTTIFLSSHRMKRKVAERMLPFERSKFVGEMAMGGYWYSAVKGVVFRAHLKGHAGLDTGWTGPVLGWRCSRSSDPTYEYEPPDGGQVKYLAMIGGLDREEDIANVVPGSFATGLFYVDRTGMHNFDELIVIEPNLETKGLIQKINNGPTLFNDQGTQALLIDTMLPVPRDDRSSLSVEECVARLRAIAEGDIDESEYY